MPISEKQVSQAVPFHCRISHTNRYIFIEVYPVFEALIVEILFLEVASYKRHAAHDHIWIFGGKVSPPQL